MDRLEGPHLPVTLTQAANVFRRHTPDFETKLDQNIALLGFWNGVYDLDAGIFRPASSADYLSMSCGYAFPTPVNSEIRAEIQRFMSDIQPNINEREYLQCMLGASLHGYKKEELFHIFTGKTRNGKSLLADIMKYSLGDYYVSVQSTMFTGEMGDAGAPSAHLAELKNRRFVVGSEPAKGKKINSGFMKGITGNDDIVGCGMYQSDMFTFKPTASFVLLCNGIPDMDENDEAYAKRDMLDLTIREADGSLKKKVKESWGPQMMHLMVEWYKTYLELGLLKTDAMEEAADKYIDQQCPEFMWYNTCTVEDLHCEGIHLKDVYSGFCNWYQVNDCKTYRGSLRTFGSALRNCGVKTPSFRMQAGRDKTSG
ncbi:hypothetical protein HDU81_001501, partial [Chytriomyces hyalinus]